ncbi:MAG: TetR/AcrR family transcriptional regulator [Chitinophagaceae bacterium]|nr:TetR/AcrR family transcriptional regulator [Oligoflexus sp.]
MGASNATLAFVSPTELKVGEDKAKRILDAAKVLFSRFGIKKTSIEEIAHQAGLGKGTVYLYFKSKDEIFSVLATGFAHEFNETLNDALKIPETARGKLGAYIETRVRFWDRCFRDYGMTAASVLEFQASSIAEDIRRRYGDGHIRIIKDLLEDGRRHGEFVFDNADTTALGVYYVLDALTRPWSVSDEAISADDKIQTCSTLLFNGLLLQKQIH